MVILIFLLLFVTTPAFALLAFPGAEGFGANVTGGRGGQVIKVTTLNATGAGSLDAALTTSGARIIVFEVSGLINGDFDITQPNVTIAGQTAPGAGITIVGNLHAPFSELDGTSAVKNIIIRHIRVRHICRTGVSESQCDAVRLSSQSEWILDHVSMSWGVDEIMDSYGGAKDWTIQNSMFERPCLDSEGSETHAFGVLNNNGGRGSLLRTGFLTVYGRSPAFADGPFDIINTVVYNHQTAINHHNPASDEFNIIGNYYKDGPAGLGKPFWLTGSRDAGTRYYFNDNNIDDDDVTPFGSFDDPWTAGHALLGEVQMGNVPADPYQATTRHDYSGYTDWVSPSILSSDLAYTRVLNTAGAFPRDIVTEAAIADARNRTGDYGCPIRDLLDEDGNYSGDHPLMTGLTAGTYPTDNDDDGMADDWETDNGLNPADGNDHDTVMASGYTAIEEYINQLADALVPKPGIMMIFDGS